MKKAIIFVDAKSDDNVDTPLFSLKVGGISLLERQLRQLNDMGVEHVYLISFGMPEMIHQFISKIKKSPKNIETVDANFIDTSFWDGLGNVLVVEEGRLLDDRIYQAVCGSGENNSLAVFDHDAVMYGKSSGLELNVDGETRVFASCAIVSPNSLKAAFLEGVFKERPLETILNLMVKLEEISFINVSQLDIYSWQCNRHLPVLWRPIAGKGECAKGTKTLLSMAQKGSLDWPARWIHPIFENAIVYYSSRNFITPNFVTLVNGALGLFVAYLFAIGQMGPALAGAMVYGVLDGVDGKLARVKRLCSKVGSLEHILNNFVEYTWYLAMAYYFANVSGNSGSWAVGLLIILFAYAQTVQSGFFRRLTSRHLDDNGLFERVFKLIGACRNTRIWVLVPFALTQNWQLGFWTLAVYSAISFFAAQWRFIVRTREYTMAKSETIADNINKARYF